MKAKDEQSQGIKVLASETFQLDGEPHRLVTFLNQSLKDRGLIFGMSKADAGRLCITVYRTD